MFPKSKEEVEFCWKILVLSCLISLFVNYDPLGARGGRWVWFPTLFVTITVPNQNILKYAAKTLAQASIFIWTLQNWYFC